MIVTAIRPEDVVPAWSDLGPMLDRAVRYTPDKPDVLRCLLSRTADLWAVIENNRPIAAIVTEMTATQGDKWCRVWIVAGERVSAWVRDFIALLEPWARECGCIGLWASGREGWAKLARRMGWKREGSDAGFPRWVWRF